MPHRQIWWHGALAIVLSLAVHAGAAYLLLGETKRAGATDRPVSAISLNLVPTQVLDSATQTPDASQASANEAVGSSSQEAHQPKDKSSDDPAQSRTTEKAAPQAKKPLEETAKPKTAKSETFQEPVSGKEKPEKATQTAAPPRTEIKRDSPKQETQERGKKRRKPKTNNSRQAVKKGSRSRASTQKRSNTKSAAISASQGQIRNYSALVRAHIARNSPRGVSGRRGTVIVAFGLTAAGRLSYVRLSRSSGNAFLDRAALSALRRAAPFPRAPRGTTPANRRFTMPFYFR